MFALVISKYLILVGCDKFEVREISAVVLEEDGTECDASYFSLLPDNILLMILCPGESWTSSISASSSQTSGGESKFNRMQ